MDPCRSKGPVVGFAIEVRENLQKNEIQRALAAQHLAEVLVRRTRKNSRDFQRYFAVSKNYLYRSSQNQTGTLLIFAFPIFEHDSYLKRVHQLS